MRFISRFIYLIIVFILLTFIVWFTISNQQDVTFNLNGAQNAADFVNASEYVKDQVTLPAFIWAFIIFAFGLLFGMIAAIISGGRGRAKKRALKKELKTTKKELTAREKEVENIRGLKGDVDPVALIQK